MMMMMKMMVLFVSSLLFFSPFSESFPLKGCVCEPAESTINTTWLVNTLRIIRTTHASSVNRTCVCLCECRSVFQLGVGDSAIEVKQREMLEDECVKLEKDLSMMEEPGDVPLLSVVFPLVGALVFFTLLLLSLKKFKGHESQPGGVLGSLIHYPAHPL